jgi:nucleoid-associated protein YgaU
MAHLLLLLLAEIGAVALTGRLAAPHRPPQTPTWTAALTAGSTGEAVVAVVHLGAWLAAWWLLAGTAHDLVVAVVSRRGRPARRRVAPAWIQRTVERAVASALAMTLAAGPAAATTTATSAPPPVEVVVRPPVAPVPLDPTAPADAAPTGVAPDDAAPADAAPADPAEDLDERRHVVAAGENLWVIARGVLSAGGTTPTDREVHAYWIRLIQANDVPSGDPDLIHPGEVLRLPAVEVGP